MKLGTKVSFDGKRYEVVAFGPRSQFENCPGVVLLGNGVQLKPEQASSAANADNPCIYVLEWDIEVLEKEKAP